MYKAFFSTLLLEGLNTSPKLSHWDSKILVWGHGKGGVRVFQGKEGNVEDLQETIAFEGSLPLIYKILPISILPFNY